ncbi:MAG: hypothetical protein WBC70_18840 [Candidatus Aminicenantales bacterium]
MKRLVNLAIVAVILVLTAGSADSYAQGVFKIPFKFKAAGKNLPAGDYRAAPEGEGQIALRKDPGGEEILIPFTERLARPETPLEEPQLVFDMVGNFEPSYTEYITEYLLAELWLPGEEGYLVHRTKGAHQDKVIKGKKAEQ